MTTATEEKTLAAQAADRYARDIWAASEVGAPFGYYNERTGETAWDFDDLAQELDVDPCMLEDMLTIAERIEAGALLDDGSGLLDADGNERSLPEDAEPLPTRADILGEWRPAYASEYLDDVLSIRYIATGRGSDDYASANIAITIGGPNIWINTGNETLEVYWGGDKEFRNLPSDFCDQLDEAAQELWEMGA